MQQLLSKFFPASHVFLYRLTGGRAGSSLRGLGILLLTTVGRQSGQLRTTLLAYITDGSAYVVAAANAGSERPPAWLLNLQQRPQVLIQVRAVRQESRAEVADPVRRQELWERLLAVAPVYGTVQQQMQREIPLVLLHPLAQ